MSRGQPPAMNQGEKPRQTNGSAPNGVASSPGLQPSASGATRASTSTSTTLNSQAKHRSPAMFKFGRKKRSSIGTDTGIRPAMKDKHRVDATDGKTRACNRAKTFETFVDGEQLGVATEDKEKVHAWGRLARGVGRLVERLRRPGRKDAKVDAGRTPADNKHKGQG